MKFRTEIPDMKFPITIEYGDKILMIGSCFSDNIGKKFAYYGFDVLFNPFGIVYNPFSISEQLKRLINKRIPVKNEFFIKEDVWQHFDFHSSFGAMDINEAIDNISNAIQTGHDFLKNTDYLFITLGTSTVYSTVSENKIVANNHKLPSDHFKKHNLDIDEVIEILKDCFNDLKKLNPKIKIIINISPVRHIRDGLIENQRSKARLIAGIEKVLEENDIYYFPSYEILIDDLRDYRFYSDDLIHPSAQAIDYIWNKLEKAFFDEETSAISEKMDKLNRSILHRPFFPDSSTYHKFNANLQMEIENIKVKHPKVILYTFEELTALLS